jgi:hypothetical protein
LNWPPCLLSTPLIRGGGGQTQERTCICECVSRVAHPQWEKCVGPRVRGSPGCCHRMHVCEPMPLCLGASLCAYHKPLPVAADRCTDSVQCIAIAADDVGPSRQVKRQVECLQPGSLLGRGLRHHEVRTPRCEHLKGVGFGAAARGPRAHNVPHCHRLDWRLRLHTPRNNTE